MCKIIILLILIFPFIKVLSGLQYGCYGFDCYPSFYQQQSAPYQQTPYQAPTQSESCEKYWSYKYEFYENFGVITIPEPHFQNSVIRVYLSIAAQLPTNFVGSIGLLKDKQSATNDISNGLPILYRVHFPLQNPLPKITGIIYNDQHLCSSPKALGSVVTTITLDHTFYTGLLYPPRRIYSTTLAPQRLYENTERTVNWVSTSYPTRRPPQISRRPPPSEKQTLITTPSTFNANNFIDLNEDVCGRPKFVPPRSTGLVKGGKSAIRGQYPWLVAYFYSALGRNEFICGGSLISSKIVVTAAHCIQNKNETSIKSP